MKNERLSLDWYRAHGLGNDYLVFEVEAGDGEGWRPEPDPVQRICARHTGVGSDGIVVLLDRAPADGVFPLRMFNPDGSEFERSGNGLRVLASYLHREGLVASDPFRVRSGGSLIEMTVHGNTEGGEYDISVEMGKAGPGGHPQRIRKERLDSRGRANHPALGLVPFTPVSVGNPHVVVFLDDLDVTVDSDDLLAELGPFLATHPAFPAGTNVQLARVTGPQRIGIEIWERGVGRTSASGTSSCAAAVAAIHTARLESGAIVVEMKGGELRVTVSPDGEVRLRGPVQEITTGSLTPAFSSLLERG